MAGLGDDETSPRLPTESASLSQKTNRGEVDAHEHSPSHSHPPTRPETGAQLPQARPTTAVSSVDIQTLSFPDGSRGTFSTPGSGEGGEGGEEGEDALASEAALSGLPPMHASVRLAPHRRAVSTSSGYATPEPAAGLYGLASGGPGGVGLGAGDAAMDAMSIVSFAPTTMRAGGPPGDLASLVAGEMHRKSRAWSLLQTQASSVQPFESTRTARVPYALADFEREFDDVNEDPGGPVPKKTSEPRLGSSSSGDEARLGRWKAKLKHYMILSSAGKPIWSRHGDLDLVNSYMGVVQTILSFYESTNSPLQNFSAGNARFVVVTEGPLYLVAISRLGESDAQLRDQLSALYMQILSTLTLPTLTNIFVLRPSTDLRKPLQGTESLLASLADSFTRGSPSALLGALECLRLRKSQRHAITQAFLRQKTPASSSPSDNLLYGLIVAGGRLVSVVRPRKHSLHPSDLQLIFNMLFASGGVKAGGGESWIPLCLPAFNSSGYLYMYVSFFDPDEGKSEGEKNQKKNQKNQKNQPNQESETNETNQSRVDDDPDSAIAIILISPDKESFFALQAMRQKVAQALAKNGSLAIIRAAIAAGRPQVADLVGRRSASASASASSASSSPSLPPLPALPALHSSSFGAAVQISHFLYKSRANVQFVMSSLGVEFGGRRGGWTTPNLKPAHSTGLDVHHDQQQQQQQQHHHPSPVEARRRLMTLYHQLHAAVHARHSHLKVLHCIGEDATSLGWVTPAFEFYCVAGPNASRSLVTQEANRIVQWAKREEERLFIIGGGVF